MRKISTHQKNLNYLAGNESVTNQVIEAFQNFDKWKTYGIAIDALENGDVTLDELRDIAMEHAGIKPNIIDMRVLRDPSGWETSAIYERVIKKFKKNHTPKDFKVIMDVLKDTGEDFNPSSPYDVLIKKYSTRQKNLNYRAGSDQKFKKWMKQVDRAVGRMAGLSVHDLPDVNFRDEFDAGTSPSEMAEIVLEEAGMSF